MSRLLDQDQQAAVSAKGGPIVCVAGPGSGKTEVIARRYLALLIAGVSPDDILSLTFTDQGAKNMGERAGFGTTQTVFRTFHSYCLSVLRQERAHLPYSLRPEIIGLQPDIFELVCDICRIHNNRLKYKDVVEAVSHYKMAGITPAQAIDEALGADLFGAMAYKDYEEKSKQRGWLDFDSLILETVKLMESNDGVAERNQFAELQLDEAQDTDKNQMKLVKLITRKHGNVFVVGDENQCQPPGTLVDVLVSPRRGSTKAHVEQVAIEELDPTVDKLVSWDHHSKRLRLGTGRNFRRSVRHFDGDLIEIHSNGEVTQVTPNHFMWVKFNRRALKTKTHFVYLMWKANFGFRIGTSSLRTACGSNQISHRGYQERADKMWVLDVVESGDEARIREEIYSLRFQIPEHIFQDKKAKRIFRSVPQSGGHRLLDEKGLEFDYPLVSWDKREKHLTKFHGYFKTVAANVLEGLMDVPSEKQFQSSVVSKIKKVEYHGPVYSLDVEHDHTYVADGIPVGNCIYEWRSAMPGSLSNFYQEFPGTKKLFLGTNYRSTRRLVEFFKKIVPVDNGLASHMRPAPNADEGYDPTFTKYKDENEEMEKVLGAVTDVENTAILARTNRQLWKFENTCIRKNIKYRLLGKTGFWDNGELKKLIELVKEQDHQTGPAAPIVKQVIERSRIIEKYRVPFKFGQKNPEENINDAYLVATRFNSIGEFLKHVNKAKHAHKNRTGLTISTVHQMKGKESDTVFLTGCDEGTMPHEKGELPEEKRIFFVAATRAAKFLHISFSTNPSQFILPFLTEANGSIPKTLEVLTKDIPGTQHTLFGGN